MSELVGGCLCGAIRYQLNSDPLMVTACHCKSCQKQTGTAYSVLLGIPADAVDIQSGAMKTYTENGTSGLPVDRKFCGDCGSPILSESKAFEGLLFVKGGTLDNTTGIDVASEIWCDSKAEWSSLGSELPKVPGNPSAG